MEPVALLYGKHKIQNSLLDKVMLFRMDTHQDQPAAILLNKYIRFMKTEDQPGVHLEVDPNKLDSKIKSFEYNGNHYLYVCHIDKYSDIPGGHKDDHPDRVKILVKSFYGKYLNMDVSLAEFNTAAFQVRLLKEIDEHLISTEPSY